MPAKQRMTRQELLTWGKQEGALRKADLSDISCQQDLINAQSAAEARRKAIGLTRGQAMDAVRMAQRAAKGFD